MTRAKKNPAPPASGHGANTSEAQDTPVESLSQQADSIGLKPGRWAAAPLAMIYDQTISAEAKMVGVALTAHADKSGYCYPGVDRLANLLGLTRRTVQRHLAALEAAGHIRRWRRTRLDGRGGYASNGYLVLYGQINRDATSGVASVDTPSDTPSKGDAIPQALPAECGRHQPIEQNQEPGGLNPTLKAATARRTTGEGTAVEGGDATFHDKRCDVSRHTDATPGVTLTSPVELAQREPAQDRAPFCGVGAALVLGSPAGLAGLIRLPRRAA